MSFVKTYNFRQLKNDEDGYMLTSICERPSNRSAATLNTFTQSLEAAREIVDEVRREGDYAVLHFTEKFDKAKMDSPEVTEAAAYYVQRELPDDAQRAIWEARRNIEKFHKAQLREMRDNEMETMPGVNCFMETRPIESVGLYIPGGTAPLPSTVLMLAVPAKLAGCKEIVLATPPNEDGSVDPSILHAANLCEIDRIFKMGGAQAIAAMAFGTKTVPKVDKIFGPGNRYVTAAKMIVSNLSGGAAIDMPAGPTELLVIADESARIDFVASDIISQAEHGEDSQILLAATSDDIARKVEFEVERQLSDLPRKHIARGALYNSFTVLVDNLDEAVEFANIYAPEHLILNVEDPNALVPQIQNAGSVFLGAYSCEAAGDYASGPNHTLPTYGHARAYSGVSVSDFQKRITFQEVSEAGARNLAPTVTKLAELEGLEGHRRAMEMRVEDGR